MGVKFKPLKNHSDPLAQPDQIRLGVFERDPVDDDIALLELLEPVQTLAEGAFPRPRRAADHDHLGAVDDLIDIVEDLELPEPLAESLDFNDHILFTHRIFPFLASHRLTSVLIVRQMRK